MRHSLPIAPQFYVTAPQPCPYLAGRVERKLFTALHGDAAVTLNDALSQQGFRRSQNVLYRPSCAECSACMSARIPVAAFAPSRTQRRVMDRNADITRPPMMLLALMRRPLRAMNTSLLKLEANWVNLAEGRACSPSLLMISTSRCCMAHGLGNMVNAVAPTFDNFFDKLGQGQGIAVVQGLDQHGEVDAGYAFDMGWLEQSA